MRKRYFAALFLIFAIGAFFLMGSELFTLFYYTFRSFLRMLGAYVLSIIFSFSLGILLIHNKTAYKIILPLLDVLQAIPILGFFPFALLFFIHTFPGGLIGEELSSIFIIFTTMTWAIIFAVIESRASFTNEMRDLVTITNLKGIKYLTHMVFPLIFPQFISGSITGWGGGWYFLVASEYLSLGMERIALPGLGTFIAQSAFSYNIPYALIGVIMLGFVVLGLNIYLWQPLLRKASPDFQLDFEKNESTNFLIDFLESFYIKFCKILENFSGIFEKPFEFLSITPEHSGRPKKDSGVVSSFFILIVFGVFCYFLFFKMPYLLENFTIFIYAATSILRLIIAFGIALVWTMFIAIFFAKNKAIMRVLMPIFDIGQSIPAVSLFPVIIILIVQTIGGRAGVEVASIVLVMTGMQWYLLFNLIRAVQNIPDEVLDLSKLFSLKLNTRLRHILVPAVLPAVFIGAIEAFGGGWNATIISEYIIKPSGEPFEIPGIGFLLSSSAHQGNLDGVILSVSAIVLIVLITNKFLWKPLIRTSDKYKF